MDGTPFLFYRSPKKEDIRRSTMNQKQPIKSVSIVRVELAKDWGHPYANLEVENPKDLASVLIKFLKKTDREVFLTINLSGINEINSINIVSVGCLTHTIVEPREVFKAAILANAFRIVIAHSHPSGTPYPSQEDIDMTRKLIQCGEILDIKIMDHIIIAGKQYLSFAEKGIGGL
jgi:DNA repair protein RadC